MKLHLISVIVRGTTFSGFFLFPENEKPRITPEIEKKLGLSFLRRGETMTIG